jgi:sugar-specific transcriptional regulator TrmB
MNNIPIELELRKLGLNEKEVKVYLTGLELGPNSAQNLAAGAKITRPTAYEIIKKLEKKGLFVESQGKNKRYFMAQSPEKILNILRTQKREIEEKEREFIRIISSLETQYLKENKEFQVFKGTEGLKALEEILSFTSTSDILIINPKNIPISAATKKKIYQEIKSRLGKLEAKEIDAEIEGGLIIFDKVIFFPKKDLKTFYLLK